MKHPLHRARRQPGGFTLIELMIGLAIIGILLLVAIPSYQEHMNHARRSDAMAALLDLSVRQEKFRSLNGTYTRTIDTEAGLGLGRTTSEGGYYNLSVRDCATGSIATCFVVEAAPVGAQASDSDCGTFSLDSTNARSASGSLGVDCWK